MKHTCVQCKSPFVVVAADQSFYKKLQLPPPTHCPSCRLQRRLSFRNERYLYRRTCDLCHRDIITFFRPGVSFPVYCNDCWWSDRWDPLSYGRDFDFTRPFFPQFRELLAVVPKIGLLQVGNENSEFNSFLAYSKNTYMSPGSYYSEDCYFVRKSEYCRDCMNSMFLDHCELVSDSVNCRNCYRASSLTNCRDCSDAQFLADCTSCKDCFMCVNLSHRQYCILNVQYTAEEYRKIKAEMQLKPLSEQWETFMQFSATQPKKFQNQINCEASSGDYIQNCKNAEECYDSFDVEDSKFLIECVDIKDSMDLSMHDHKIELSYEMCSGGGGSNRSFFSFCCVWSTDVQYCYSCMNINACFGCDSIHSKTSHCILNKQYDAEGFTALRAKIIAHMKETGEYGEFFPTTLSLYPYNQTIAADYFPLSKDEAQSRSYLWDDEDERRQLSPTASVPTQIEKVPDQIVNEILSCARCHKNYRIIAQELKLSRQLGVPLSVYCTDCRYRLLLARKNPRKLWNRTCSRCNAAILTPYAPERPEQVFCESCYRESVY